MKYGELMAALRQGPLPHVFLLAGEEHYYIEKARERLLQLLFPDPGALQDGLQKFTGDVDLGTLLGTLDTVPFFADKNVVLVQDTRLFKASSPKAGEESGREGDDKSRQRLLSFLENMPEYSYLLFVTDTKPDKRKKLYKAVEKVGLVLEAEPVRAWNIGDWLTGKLNSIDKQLDKEALAYFQGAVSLMQPISLDFLDKEFDKLALFTDRRLISKKELVQVFAGIPEVSGFALLDAVSARDARQALALLDRQLAEGTYFTIILALLTRHVRQLWQARVLISRGVRGKALAQPLGLNPYIAEKLGRAAAKFPESVLKRGMLELIDGDYLLKTGQAGEECLEHALIVLCTADS